MNFTCTELTLNSNTVNSEEAEEPEDVPIIFHRYEGYSAMDTRTLVAQEVTAVSAGQI